MGKQQQEKEEKIVTLPKNAAELQRLRLDRLMKNPEKPVHVPDPSKPYNPRGPLEFIRNVWGSSAGAGSGDFHVYRGVRRREYARQKFIKETSEKEGADETYHKKMVENAVAAEERTSKKRAKRQKKKKQQKNNKKQKKEVKKESSDEDESEDEVTNGAEESTNNGNDVCVGPETANNQPNNDAKPGVNTGECEANKDSVNEADDSVDSREGECQHSSDSDEKCR